MDARAQPGVGKSDPLDAHRIARAVLPLSMEQLRQPRSDQGIRAALRVLTAARDQMTTQRTAAVNALTALLRHVDLGVDAQHYPHADTIAAITRWRSRIEETACQVARAEAIRLAAMITSLDDTLKTNLEHTTSLLRSSPARPCSTSQAV